MSTMTERLHYWRELSMAVPHDFPATMPIEDFRTLLADAERMASVLREYGKAIEARAAYPNSPSKGGAETWSKRVFVLDKAVSDALAAVEALAVELAKEEA